MDNLSFPLLKAADLEARVASIKGPDDKQPGGVSLLVYKNARIDQNILDATVGPMGWQNRFYEIAGKLHCVIGIWDAEKGLWVERDNVGTESNTEQIKGEASDAFKRAAFNWGIGRELYTAPFIWIPGNKLPQGAIQPKDGKFICRTRFVVTDIDYDDQRKINKLVISDDKGNVLFNCDKTSKSNSKSQAYNKPLSELPNALDVAFATKATVGVDAGKTLKEVYELKSGTRIFYLYDNDTDIVKEAVKVIIDNNQMLSKYFKDRYSTK